MNVRDGRRNGGKFGTKDPRQAHQMDVIVEGRVGFVGPEKLVDAGKRVRELADAAPDLQQDARSKRLDVGRITDELEYVPDTLLGSQKKRLATQILTVPHRLAKRGPATEK